MFKQVQVPFEVLLRVLMMHLLCMVIRARKLMSTKYLNSINKNCGFGRYFDFC